MNNGIALHTLQCSWKNKNIQSSKLNSSDNIRDERSFSKNIQTRYPSHREAPNCAACNILSIGRLPLWLFSSLSSRSASRRVNRQFTTLKLISSNQFISSCHIKLIKFCVYHIGLIVFSVLKDISSYMYSLSSGQGTECPLVAIFWFHPL